MKQEFEIISHKDANFKIFLVHMLYRTPHIHKDFEIGFLLDGEISLISQRGTAHMKPGDFYIMNPFQSHELKADAAALMLSIQVQPSFFSSYYPQIENLEFMPVHITDRDIPEAHEKITGIILELALAYLKKDAEFELKCAGLLNFLLAGLLKSLPYRTITYKEQNASRTKAKRMRKILHYIDGHYHEKLLLSEIAQKEELSLSYLSHFFKDCFGISFQEYLLKTRCEKARQLLLLTDQSLLDICISCGFSDPKYFNSGFRRQYGCLPKDYRRNFHLEEPKRQHNSMLSAQEFLSADSALVLLESYLSKKKRNP